jgi:methylmalonyl-CoA mutase N-terminal domain/subunit
MDESLALPTEHAVRIALRTQQILAFETGVPNTIDPLAGSYFVESMTDELERQAEEIFAEIDDLGGVVAGIESGYFQARIARSASRFQDEVEARSRLIVGVNSFQEDDEPDLEILRIDESAAEAQAERLAALRERRDDGAVEHALRALTAAVMADDNLMPPMLDAVRAYATLGEIRIALETVYGRFQEPVAF